MHLTDLAPKALWDQMRTDRMIAVQTHPTLPLFIYNYTQNAQFSKTWNAATLTSRGLIADSDGNIVSYPFTKFFNYGELSSDELAKLKGQVVASDKLDGSMGVSYVNPETGKLNIATRGSFASDQALHATQLYLSKYDGAWEPRDGSTYIWEIIYPDNRIVLNYGDKDDLVLIGRVDNETGRSASLNEITEWPFERAEVFEHKTLDAALSATPRENAEGIVVHFVDSDSRVKIKQEDYVRLHRIVTGVTKKRVWEVLASGDSLEDWLADMPEEFADFIREVAAELQVAYDEIASTVEDTYSGILNDLPYDFTQKDFALEVNKRVDGKMRGLLFSRHKGTEPAIWGLIKPEHEPLTAWGS